MIKLTDTVFPDELTENEDLNTVAVLLEEFGTDSVTVVNRPVYMAVKRSVDIVASLCALIVLLIPMLVIALLIRIESPGPAIFTQKRMGKGGKPFVMYKFRTMRMDAHHEMATRDFVDADKYVTKIGAFLRRTSLDELLQLLNVLACSMSLVGYRPICLTETDLNDLRIVRECSIKMDLWCLIKTVAVVFTDEGVV